MPRPKIAKPCKLCGELLTCNEAKHAADSCGAKLRSYARNHGPEFYRLCPEAPGWKTDHEGQGKCKRHGGLTPSKHGLYSSIQRPRLQEIIKEIQESGADPFDLVPEIELLRAHIRDYHERCEGEPEAEAVSMLIDRTSKVIERAAKVRDNSPLTIESVSRSYEGMAQIVAKRCGEAGQHELASKILADWQKIPVG
jgi:hypothetical protein